MSKLDASHDVPRAVSFDPPDLLVNDPVGIGLRSPHYQEIIDNPPNLGWLEIHPENHFGGGLHRHYLRQIRQEFPISMHGVGLSLGSDQGVDTDHLRQFKELIDIFDPFIVSDHVSWSASGNAHLNDLLPLPYNSETLNRLCDNIDKTQTYFGRKILVENPSTYLSFRGNEMTEYEFLNLICDRTGCGVLLDVNNIYVQSHNHGIDPIEYIDNINANNVGEMHLAGHIERSVGDNKILIDSHNQLVRNEVWDLYSYAIGKIGAVPTLIEWDQDFPPLDILIEEASRARSIIEREASESAKS
ncbi:MAG: MNIO family bufferin maturase [Alphaproteobacteria bacterium]